MPRRVRAVFVSLTATLAITAFLVGAGASTASASTAEKLSLAWNNGDSVMTLPSSDSFNDEITLEVASNHGGPGQISAKRISGSGGGSLLTAQDLSLSEVSSSHFTGEFALSDAVLTAGSWEVEVKVDGLTKSIVAKVGSGIAKTVTVTPLNKHAFTNEPDPVDEVSAHVVARDETGVSLPIITGFVNVTSAHAKDTTGGKSFASSSSTTPGATISSGLSVGGFNNGTGTVQAFSIEGPTSSAHDAQGKADLTLEDAKLTGASIYMAFSTIYPNMDGYHNSDYIAGTVTNNTPDQLALGTFSLLQIVKGTTIVESIPIDSTGTTSTSWNGETSGTVVPGKYNIFVTGVLPNGNTVTKEGHVEVSAAEPVPETLSVSYLGKDLKNQTSTSDPHNVCKPDGSAVKCVSTGSSSVSAAGEFSVPSTVLKLAGSIDYSASVSVTVKDLSSGTGTVTLLLITQTNNAPSAPITIDGVTSTSAYNTFTDQNRDLYVGVFPNGQKSLEVTKVTIHYTYSVIG